MNTDSNHRIHNQSIMINHSIYFNLDDVPGCGRVVLLQTSAKHPKIDKTTGELSIPLGILQTAETVPEPTRSFPARAAFRTNTLG